MGNCYNHQSFPLTQYRSEAKIPDIADCPVFLERSQPTQRSHQSC
jgi:hypothetical protein